jgi:hypothetical protein
MKRLWNYLKTQKLLFGVILLIGVAGFQWNQIEGKPHYTIGDTGCATLSAAITTIGSTQTTLVIPPGSTQAGDALTIPSTLNLRVEKGGLVSISNAATFTINGHLEAGPHKVFSCAGTGLVKFANTSNQVSLFPAWWGAAGDGTTNDTDAWQRCFNTATAYVSGTYGYYTIEATSKAKYLVEEITVSSASDPYFLHIKGNNSTFVQATTNNILSIPAINSMVRISDFYFSGAAGDVGYGIAFGAANTSANIKIYNCRFNNFASSLYALYSIGVTIEDCEFFNGGTGIKEFTTNNSHVSNCWYINRCLFSATTAAAIDIDSSVSGGNAGNYSITNCIFETPAAEAIKMNGVYRFLIDNCYIEGGANANADNPIMRLTTCTNGEIKRTGFGWSTANLTATDAVYMTDCYNILFDQCTHHWTGTGGVYKGFYKTTNSGNTIATSCHNIEIKRLASKDGTYAILTSGNSPVAKVVDSVIYPFTIQPAEFIGYSPGRGELQECSSSNSMMGLFNVAGITATNATLTKDETVTYNGHPTYRIDWTGASPSITFDNFFDASTVGTQWPVLQFFYRSDTAQVVNVACGSITDPNVAKSVPIAGDSTWRSFSYSRWAPVDAWGLRKLGIISSTASSGKIWIAIPSFRQFGSYNGAAAGMSIRSYY